MFRNIVDDYPYHIIGWYMLHICYKKIGDKDESSKCIKTIKKLLETDNRAVGMFLKYEKTLSDLDIQNIDIIKIDAGDTSFRDNFATSTNHELSNEDEYTIEIDSGLGFKELKAES
jgi:hypothetical protein